MKKAPRKTLQYEGWEIHPELAVKLPPPPPMEHVIWKSMSTKHEGNILYWKLWNFWVRAGTKADMRSDIFFRDYESANEDTDALLRDVGFPWRKAETEEEVWGRVAMVWNWLKENVQVNNEEYVTISSVDNSWPSILDYARYHAQNGNLV